MGLCGLLFLLPLILAIVGACLAGGSAERTWLGSVTGFIVGLVIAVKGGQRWLHRMTGE